MESHKERIGALVIILIFMASSVLLIIHTFSHSIGGFSLFVIAVLAFVSFCLLVMACTYNKNRVRNSGGVVHSTRMDDPWVRFNGVSIIQVPYLGSRNMPPDTSPPTLMHVYSPPMSVPGNNTDLPAYIEDPPPDYYTATRKQPESVVPCNEATPPAAPTTTTNENKNGVTREESCSEDTSNNSNNPRKEGGDDSKQQNNVK